MYKLMLPTAVALSILASSPSHAAGGTVSCGNHAQKGQVCLSYSSSAWVISGQTVGTAVQLILKSSDGTPVSCELDSKLSLDNATGVIGKFPSNSSVKYPHKPTAGYSGTITATCKEGGVTFSGSWSR